MNKILLMEESSYFRKYLLGGLNSRFPGIEIEVALNHEKCLAIMRTFKPHILFLNIADQEGIKSLQLLKQIRETDKAATIIVLMEYDFLEYRNAAILEGADYFISKEIWTRNEILALTGTILGDDMPFIPLVRRHDRDGKATEKNYLERPLERRQKNIWGQLTERQYLKQQRDRRNNKQDVTEPSLKEYGFTGGDKNRIYHHE